MLWETVRLAVTAIIRPSEAPGVTFTFTGWPARSTQIELPSTFCRWVDPRRGMIRPRRPPPDRLASSVTGGA